jgi:hypothetical protein
MVSTHPGGEGRRLAALLFARWSQENYFRYMRQHFGLDALVEHGTEAMPDTAFTVNPAWRELNAKVRQKQAQWRRLKAMLGAATLEQEISESAVTEYQLQQGQLQDQSEHLQRELEGLKEQRKAAPHHVLVKDLIKMISYRAETSMVSMAREKLARTDDGRALLRQIFTTAVDLIPDLPQQTLTVRLHHLTQRAHDGVIRHLCEELTATETLFPGTGLRLIYQLGSS